MRTAIETVGSIEPEDVPARHAQRAARRVPGVEADVIAYKFLRTDGSTVFSGFRWPLPGDEPGPWVEAPVDPCRSGIHACRPGDLSYWVGQTLYEIELDGEIVEERNKVIASRGRLLRRVDAWEDELRDEFTRDVRRPRARDRARGAGADAPWTPTSNRRSPTGRRCSVSWPPRSPRSAAAWTPIAPSANVRRPGSPSG